MRDLRAEREARAERERREHDGIKREMARVLNSRLVNRDPQTGFYVEEPAAVELRGKEISMDEHGNREGARIQAARPPMDELRALVEAAQQWPNERNDIEIGRWVTIHHTTLSEYLALLETLTEGQIEAVATSTPRITVSGYTIGPGPSPISSPEPKK